MMPKTAAPPPEKALVRLESKADKLRQLPGALNLVTDGMKKETDEIRRACLTTPRLAPSSLRGQGAGCPVGWVRIGLAGTPTTVAPSGTSLTTTAPAPTVAPLPTLTYCST